MSNVDIDNLRSGDLVTIGARVEQVKGRDIWILALGLRLRVGIDEVFTHVPSRLSVGDSVRAPNPIAEPGTIMAISGEWAWVVYPGAPGWPQTMRLSHLERAT